MPKGCRFEPRCPYAMDTCRAFEPELRPVEGGRKAACWLNVPREQHPVPSAEAPTAPAVAGATAPAVPKVAAATDAAPVSPAAASDASSAGGGR